GTSPRTSGPRSRRPSTSAPSAPPPRSSRGSARSQGEPSPVIPGGSHLLVIPSGAEGSLLSARFGGPGLPIEIPRQARDDRGGRNSQPEAWQRGGDAGVVGGEGQPEAFAARNRNAEARERGL